MAYLVCAHKDQDDVLLRVCLVVRLVPWMAGKMAHFVRARKGEDDSFLHVAVSCV